MKRERRVVLIAVLSLLAVTSGSSARADGGFFPPENGTANSADQRAVIVDQGDTQTIILETAYEGDRSDFAWVIPLPELISGQECITTAAPDIFDKLRERSEPRWWSQGSAALCGCGGSATIQEPPVTVWERLRVDDYDVAILSAQQSSDLATWLNDNGYSFPEAQEPTLEYYVNRGWYFVAFKMAPTDEDGQAGAPNDGGFGGGLGGEELKPIQMTFPTDQLIFPLRISQISSLGRTEILLYVIAPHRMHSENYATAQVDVPDSYNGGDFQADYAGWFEDAIADAGGTAFVVEYAGEVSSNFADFVGIGDLVDGSQDYFVTRLRTYLTPAQMTEDVKLVAAPSDDPFEVNLTSSQFTQARIGLAGGMLLIAGVQAFAVRSSRRRGYVLAAAVAGAMMLIL